MFPKEKERHRISIHMYVCGVTLLSYFVGDWTTEQLYAMQLKLYMLTHMYMNK